MANLAYLSERSTSTDAVYNYLHGEIISVRMPPGSKISEAEIAGQFGVSRQPVRDAFNRLANEGLLLVRPQRATEVRKFSTRGIDRARFARIALEVEIIRRLVASWDGAFADAIESNLADQRVSVCANDDAAFHRHDYEFHRLLCEAAHVGYAFDTLFENKMHVDRLCVLSLINQDGMEDLLQDHEKIIAAVTAGDAERAEAALRHHLGRLGTSIEKVRALHPDYFED